MANKPIIRKTISDAQLKAELIKLFESGNTSNSNLYELLRTSYKLMKQRFIKIYHSTLKEWQDLKERAIAEQIQANTSDTLKKAVMSKEERLVKLSKMLEDDFRIEDIAGVDLKNGKVIRVKRPLTPKEIQMVIAEINRMQGDYAVKKHEVNHKFGLDAVEEVYE